MCQMYVDIDIINIPAGMTAAIYAARRKIKFILLSLDVGGQMVWSPEIDNYPGIPDSTGMEIVNKFNQHLKDYKIKVKTEEVLSLTKKDNICIVKTNKKIYESKAVIIASGKKPKKLNVPGEDKYVGRGVSFCATCDAPLYKDKKVAVIGGGNSGMEAALFLSKYAKKVYLLNLLENLTGEPHLKEKVQEEKRISIIPKAKTLEILGNEFITGLKYIQEEKEKQINIQGVFIEVGLVTNVDFTDVKKNKWGEIMIFRSSKTHEENMTNIPGIFAAGDVTDIPSKQIVIAAGEGAKSALASFDYINKWK